MGNKNKNTEDAGLMTADEAKALVKGGAIDLADYILDAKDVVTKLFDNSDAPKATIQRVVKLQRGQALRGKFRGYEPVMVTAPGTDRQTLMNFVLIEPAAGVILKHLGTAQIMQGMATAQVHIDTVTILRRDEEDIEISGGKRVKPFDVLIDRDERTHVQGGYSKPFGEWGNRMEQATRAAIGSGNSQAALPAGKTIDAVPAGYDEKTGAEVKA